MIGQTKGENGMKTERTKDLELRKTGKQMTSNQNIEDKYYHQYQHLQKLKE